jgi:septal ring factor EnvC (AmiA/AmiB activator)
MFETDEKKSLKHKYNKLSSIANKQIPGLEGLKMGGNSVYGELKLSEKLNDELRYSKSLINDLREELDETCNTRDRYQRELD